MVVAWRAPDLVLSVEYFSSGRTELHPETAHLEKVNGGRAGAVASSFVGGIYFAVLLHDVRLAHGVLQFWRVAGDCDAAWNWFG